MNMACPSIYFTKRSFSYLSMVKQGSGKGRGLMRRAFYKRRRKARLAAQYILGAIMSKVEDAIEVRKERRKE